MIISCDHCHAPYTIDESQFLSPDGEGVRNSLALECSACRHRFVLQRKVVFVVEPYVEAEEVRVERTQPAEEEGNTSQPSISAAREGQSGTANENRSPALRTRPRVQLPLRSQPATNESSHGFRTFLVLILLLAGGGLLAQHLYPTEVGQATAMIDQRMNQVTSRLHPADSVNPAAKNHYLAGRGAAVLDVEEQYQISVQSYRAATAADDRYAAAFGSLAEAAAELAEISYLRNDVSEGSAWLEESLRASTKAITLDAQCVEALRGLAAYERLQNRFVKAQEQLDKALLRDPTDAEVHVAIGRNYLSRQGLEDMAKQYLLKAVSLDDRSLRAHRYLAVTFTRLGSMAEAAKHWQRVLELNSDHLLAQQELQRLQAPAERARASALSPSLDKASPTTAPSAPSNPLEKSSSEGVPPEPVPE